MKKSCQMVGWSIGLAGFIFAPWVAASQTPSDYLEALKIAEQKVLREKAAEQGHRANALSVSPLTSLLGRGYQIGDTWDVAAWRSYPTMMRKTGNPEQLKSQIGQLGVFRFKVSEIRNQGRNEPKVVFSVTQLQEDGAPIVDPRVESMTLMMNHATAQTTKSVHLTGQKKEKDKDKEKAPSAIERSPLEFFPLDVPEVVSAQRSAPSEVPELPPALQELASTAQGFHPDLSHSAWFEQDDFYGRPVQMLWQQGDPWPSYLKTPRGVAILLRKGGNR